MKKRRKNRRDKKPLYDFTKFFKQEFQSERTDAITKVTLRKLRKYYLNLFKKRTKYLIVEESNWRLLEYLDSYIR